ncbi:MAG: 3D domain-containing protein [Syntrophobacterales bacterium]|nr:MAG: 3D domain-containing protein [Syntrophobacterales bacterium]
MEKWLNLIGPIRVGGKILLCVGIFASVLFSPGLVAQEDAVKIRAVPVKVTAYNPVRSQTDSSPHITASNKRVRVGMVALSRDLEREFGLTFGDTIHLNGIGSFVFEDRMHRRKRRHVDILMFNIMEARKFGVKNSHLILLEESKGEGRKVVGRGGFIGAGAMNEPAGLP